MSALSAPGEFCVPDALTETCRRLERALERERRARYDAEAIAERGLRELYLSRSRLELLHRISSVANEANDPIATLRLATQEVCAATGWALGHVLLTRGETGEERLEGTDIWFAQQPDRMFPLIEASRRLIIWPCASNPGRLFIDPMPRWTPDIHAQAGFTRSALAAQCRLRAGVAMPVLAGTRLVAAIEFFSADATQPDPELLELLMQIGMQAGRVFKRQRHSERLMEHARRDALTGLPNRTPFLERLAVAFDAIKAEPAGDSLALLYMDLDGFKLVNDTLGHLAGDQLLVAMAQRLQTVIDDYTRAFPENQIMLARIGGDEFALFCRSTTAAATGDEIAEAIHAALGRPYRIGGNEVYAKASIGIALSADNYDDVAAMLRDADLAMYAAKSSGPGNTVLYCDDMRARALARLEIEEALRNGLEAGHFVLHYQPIVHFEDRSPVGFEALVRWRRDGGDGLVPPNDFIPIAEQSGLIVPLGSWVMREACAAAERWRSAVGSNRAFYISINVAPQQFLVPNFVEQVRQALVETGADPRDIAIEMTESAAVANPAHTAAVIEALRCMGIRVSIDDFGTGYASLSHLQTLPFDTLKIDRSFINDVDVNEANLAIVSALAQMAHAMGMGVIAEGVETDRQLERIAAIGCDTGQGWLFNHSLPEAEALALLR